MSQLTLQLGPGWHDVVNLFDEESVFNSEIKIFDRFAGKYKFSVKPRYNVTEDRRSLK